MSGPTRLLAAAVLAAGGLGAAASVQARQTAPAPAASMEQLLAEARGLRAEIRDAAASSLRAQLVGMRLQLQEQRITTLSRQLSDIQEKLRSQEGAMVPLTAALKMFKEDDDNKEELEMITAPLKAQLAQLEKAVQQLKQEEVGASQLLAEEQSRWTRFNALVEELEKSAAARPAPVKR